MNRCSQVLADTCTKSLAAFVANSNPIEADKLTFNCSLKYSIINDPAISVEMTSPTRFEIFENAAGVITPNGPIINEARVSDFLLGATRVKNQYDSVIKMRNSGGPAAWTLVSAYYCAYFSCIELCKVINRIALSLEGEELSSLANKSSGPAFAAFFAAGHSNFVGTHYAGKIVFDSVGTKPHVAAWDNVLHAIRKIFSGKDWADAQGFVNILSDSDFNPSRIRNTWNYKRSDYYGPLGENAAREFKTLIGNHEGAYNWLKRTSGRVAPLDPCIVAMLSETLSSAVLEAAKRTGELMRQKASQDKR